MLNLCFGYVTNFDGNGRVRVLLPEFDDLVSDFMPVLRQNTKDNKDGNFLDIDEQVAVLYDSDKDTGVVMGAISTDACPLPVINRDKKYFSFSDGSNIEYDRKEHTLTLDIKGNVSIKADNATIDAQKINLGNGGKAIARIGDTVQVDGKTHIGTITSGGVNTSL